jgi:hypothetical protein
MAPPKFADLSKKFKDLSSDDFGFNHCLAFCGLTLNSRLRRR